MVAKRAKQDNTFAYGHELSILVMCFQNWMKETYEDEAIRPNMFGESDHKAIYEALIHLYEADEPVLLGAVKDYLAKKEITLKNPTLLDDLKQKIDSEVIMVEEFGYSCQQLRDQRSKNRIHRSAAKLTETTHFANGNLKQAATIGLNELAETVKTVTADLSDRDKVLLQQSPDDDGNARSVNYLYAGNFLHCDALGWLFYNGTYWETENAENKLDRAIVETLKRRRALGVKIEDEKLIRAAKPSSSNVRNCKYLLKSLAYASIGDFDNDPDLLNCANGVVNLKTGELTPHDHTQRFTYCIDTDYDPAADDTQWATWLYDTITPAGADDNGQYADLAAWLQTAIGYSLTGHTHEQCLFFLQGPPRAGKGVFLQTLDRLLGRPLSSGVDFDTFTAKRGGDNQNFDLAPLKSCRLITATESERTTMLNAKRVKSITGNDPVYCAHKRKDFFSYTPQYKIWLSSNFRVMAAADDDALWSRLRIINFPNSHLGKEDFGLEARLWTDRAGILKWAIDGAMTWYQRKAANIGLGRLEIITRAAKAHRDENDTVGQFIEDCCIVRPDNYAVGVQLTSAYKSWCDENSVSPLGGRRLTEAFTRRDFEYKAKKVAGKTTKCWLGIGLEI